MWRGLNRVLFRQLHDKFVSGAYFWLDTENRKAWYSAAGHPPLLRWRGGQLQRVDSNGPLFGVIPDPDYPVCNLPIQSRDRFLLYTDGVIEAENASGDPFGDCKLEHAVYGSTMAVATPANTLISSRNTFAVYSGAIVFVGRDCGSRRDLPVACTGR